MGALSEHDIDFATSYCRRCGSGAHQIMAEAPPRPCLAPGVENVIAISHVISARRWRELVDAPGSLAGWRLAPERPPA